MTEDLTGFEFIALDQMADAPHRRPFDLRTMESLEQKGMIVLSAGEWLITHRGRMTVMQVMGS